MSDTQTLTHDQATAVATEWLNRRSLLKDMEAAQKKATDELLSYFATTEEKTVGGVICYSRKYTSTGLEPTAKKYERSVLVDELLTDERFSAFTGERVMGDAVLEAAAADKKFRGSLERRGLIETHLDETAVAKSAADNPLIAAALKEHHLAAEVTVSTKWYLKA